MASGGHPSILGAPRLIWTDGSPSFNSCPICASTLSAYGVKPTFPKIEAATTLTFPEWRIYYHPHPSRTTNGVAFLVRNTVAHFVVKDGNQSASLFTDPDGTFLGLTLQFPNKARLRVLNYYGLQTVATKKRQDAFAETHQWDILMGDFNDSIWSNTPSRFWHNHLLTRHLCDRLHERYRNGSIQAGQQGHMTHDQPSFDEFKRACMGTRKKAVDPEGVPHRLLGMLLDDTLHMLYQGPHISAALAAV